AFSMPAIIGKDGIEKVFELKFNEKEKTKLENSKQQIKNAIQSVKDKNLSLFKRLFDFDIN
ncbi:L-lactate dehydrogenase, partial [Campylobacter jejuni]|nr:L-lactate dehydrogenase [Campylobacter jejuni]